MLIMGGRADRLPLSAGFGIYEYQAVVMRKIEQENGVDSFQRLGRAYLKFEEGQCLLLRQSAWCGSGADFV